MKNNRSRETSVNRDKRIVSKSFKKFKTITINLTSQQRLPNKTLRCRYYKYKDYTQRPGRIETLLRSKNVVQIFLDTLLCSQVKIF